MRFVVELVQTNAGGREDTLEHVQSALKRLFHISNTALAQIEARLNTEQIRLAGLETRITACRGKLASVSKLTTYPILPSMPTTNHNLPLLADFPSQISAGHGAKEQQPRRTDMKDFMYDRDPVIPIQVLEHLEAKIRDEVKHKVALDSQLHASSSDATPITVTTTVVVAVPTEYELGPAPDSLLRANLLSTANSRASLQQSTNSNAVATGGNEDLSFHHQQLQSARATPDSLGLPADLSGVLGNVTTKHQQQHTALSPLRQQQQRGTKRPQSLPVLLPPPVTVVTPTPVEEAPPSPAAPQQQRTVAASPIVNLLSEIRERKPLQPTKQRNNNNTKQQEQQTAVTRPKTLAEEMREKLNRRQAMLSGEGDEEEQRMAKRKLGSMMRDNDDARSFISTSTIGPPPPAPARGTALLKLQNPPAKAPVNDQVPLMPSFDRVFEREMTKKHLLNKQQQQQRSDSEEEEDWEVEQ